MSHEALSVCAVILPSYGLNILQVLLDQSSPDVHYTI